MAGVFYDYEDMDEDCDGGFFLFVLPGAMMGEFKAPDPPANARELGSRIQRTMSLLANSTPKHRRHVRILFYGQSVTRNPWWRDVANYLRKTFPHAELEIANRAIGGYTAPTLIHTAEADLYPFYPDLLIFHVYGGVRGREQEKIIQRVRQRTTSEILLWTSHFRWPQNLPRDGNPEDPAARRLYQLDEARTIMIRDLAKKYGCELAEVRESFRSYLKQNHLFPKDALHDSVHPNALGNFLIGHLMFPYFRYDPGFSDKEWKDLVTDVPAEDNRVRRGADGSLELDFEGNRVDVIPGLVPGQRPGPARVLLDDKPPSQCPELYYHAKTSLAPFDRVRPAINRIDHQAPLQIEKWTARILECDPAKNVLRYEVIGSKTGPDGQGDQRRKFVSKSGRVVIEPGRWMVCWALKYRKKELPGDYKITWEVKPLFKDSYEAPEIRDSSLEYATTLAQGFSNSRHTLRVVPERPGALPIKAFRVYRPPLR